MRKGNYHSSPSCIFSLLSTRYCCCALMSYLPQKSDAELDALLNLTRGGAVPHTPSSAMAWPQRGRIPSTPAPDTTHPAYSYQGFSHADDHVDGGTFFGEHRSTSEVS